MLYWLTTNLWTTGQGLVTRRLMPKPELPEKRSSRTPAKDEPPRQPASGNGAGNTPKARAARPQARRRPAAPRQAQEGRRRGQAMTRDHRRGDGRDGRRGEVDRPARARSAACRASTATRSGSRSSARASAACSASATRRPRSIATAEVPRAAQLPAESHDDETSQAALVRELLERTVAASGVPATVRIDETGEELVATLVGPDLGVLIGRHGQTIDALQYLANAIGHRTQGDDRLRVVVDAAGYRARRAATLETARPPRRRSRQPPPAIASSSSR